MLFRDFMQKYRPLLAPEDGTGSAPAADAAAPVAAAADAAPAPVADAAVAAPTADAAAAVHQSEPSLLESAEGKTGDTKSDAAPEAKPEGAADETPAPADAAKPDDAKPEADAKAEGDADKKDAADADPAKKDATAEAPPAPIKYDAFKLPDGLTLDDERIGKFTEIAGKAQVPQDVAQDLLNLHLDEMKRIEGEIRTGAEKNQRDVWSKLNDTWKGDARKEFGNRLDTALSRAKAVIEEYGGTPEQVRELMAHTTNNGMGNFPGFIRFLDNIAEVLNVFEESPAMTNTTPPKVATSRGERWYGGSMNGTPKS